MAVAIAADTPSEREQLLLAERDAALATVRKLIAVIAKCGGPHDPKHQQDYLDAKALVGIGTSAKAYAPTTPAWAKGKP